MFGFNNYSKPGKGINKEDLDKSGVSLYFDIFFRRIWKMMTLNLMYLLVSIPAIVISILISAYFLMSVASLAGVDVVKNSTLLGILSLLFAIVFLQVTGSGPASVAKSYVLRKYVRDTHSWVVSDFFENIKSNFKQGIAVYIINTLVSAGLIFAYIFYSFIWKNSMGSLLSVVVIIIAVIFVMMQMYVHQLVSSVKLKVKHIYINALALTVVKLPWNIVVLFMTFFLAYLMCYFALTSPAICVVFVIALYFTLVCFTQIFMTNNVMNKYVIEPGKKTENEEQ